MSLQERTGVQMIMIQDDPMPTGADKPLRITGDPHKVQVGPRRGDSVLLSFPFALGLPHFVLPVYIGLVSYAAFIFLFCL